MGDVEAAAAGWLADGRRVALALVVSAGGPSPRGVGSLMAVCETGDVEGSVSAGCLEGAVICEASEALACGRARLVSFGLPETGDDEAAGSSDATGPSEGFGVGPLCGGALDVLVTPLNLAVARVLADGAASGRPVELVVRLPYDGDDGAPAAMAVRASRDDGGEDVVAAGDMTAREFRRAMAHLDHDAHAGVASPARGADDVQAGVVTVDGVDYVARRTTPSPRLVCVGATHVTQRLVTLARAVGYRTVVVDPRAAFVSEARFPDADELVVDWPQRAFPRLGLDARTAVCALTHDEKIDVPAVACALASEAFYVGCLGRVTTQVERRAALLARGVQERSLARVYGPIGAWTGGKRPEDIALSVMAQVNAVRNGALAHLGPDSARTLAEIGDA